MSASFQHEFYSLFIYPHIWLTNDDALLPLLRATRDRETRWEFKVTYCYSTFCQGQIADIHKKDNYLFSIDLKLFFFFFFLKKRKVNHARKNLMHSKHISAYSLSIFNNDLLQIK